MVQLWVDNLPLAPSTATTVLRILQTVLNAAVNADVIAVSPARKVEAPKVRRTRVTIVPVAVVEQLAAAISPRYRVCVWLAADAGYGRARCSACYGLTSIGTRPLCTSHARRRP